VSGGLFTRQTVNGLVRQDTNAARFGERDRRAVCVATPGTVTVARPAAGHRTIQIVVK